MLSELDEKGNLDKAVLSLMEALSSIRPGRSPRGLPESSHHPIGDRATDFPHFRSDCVPEGVFVAERNLVGSQLALRASHSGCCAKF